VDLKKVNMDIIKKWISDQVTEAMGCEDEVTINLAINDLETNVDGKRLQVGQLP